VVQEGAVANERRIREVWSGPLTEQYIRERAEAGWRIAAIEWVRQDESAEPPGSVEEVPYGLRVADDCAHLEEDPAERQTMLLMLEMIIQDVRLPEVAAELNRRGYRTRAGTPWGPVNVFNLLPRMIEVGPRIFSSEEWGARRPRLLNVV
jgi:hypothetical protein